MEVKVVDVRENFRKRGGDVVDGQSHVVCNYVFKWLIIASSRGQIADVIGGPRKMVDLDLPSLARCRPLVFHNFT